MNEEIIIKPIRALRLTRRERNVYEMLRAKKTTVTEITVSLGYSDPRSYIKRIKAKGANIQSEWIQRDNIRFKRYWSND